MRIRFILSLVVLMFISGCQNVKPFSQQDKQRIKSIYVERSVKKAPEMHYMTAGDVWVVAGASMGGAVGAALLSSSKQEGSKTERDFVAQLLADNEIRIEDIFLEEIFSELAHQDQFEIVDSVGEADAILIIDIYQYGFGPYGPFGGTKMPILSVDCQLQDASGSMVWRAGNRMIGNSDSIISFDLESALNEPEIFREIWAQASNEMATSVVSHLLRN